jgi:hypothetical protein
MRSVSRAALCFTASRTDRTLATGRIPINRRRRASLPQIPGLAVNGWKWVSGGAVSLMRNALRLTQPSLSPPSLRP